MQLNGLQDHQILHRLTFFFGVTLRARFLKHRKAILKNSSSELDMKRTNLDMIEQWYDVPFSTWSGGQESVYKEMEDMLKTEKKLLLLLKLFYLLRDI